MPYKDPAKNNACKVEWSKTPEGVAYNKKWYEENRERLREYERLRSKNKRGMEPGEYKRWLYTIKLKSHYDLSREEYDAMVMESNGLCEICQKPPMLGLDLDHNHETGKARGLLCRNCNSVLGKFETYRDEILKYLSRL
jgi:hypothetical protein